MSRETRINIANPLNNRRGSLELSTLGLDQVRTVEERADSSPAIGYSFFATLGLALGAVAGGLYGKYILDANLPVPEAFAGCFVGGVALPLSTHMGSKIVSSAKLKLFGKEYQKERDLELSALRQIAIPDVSREEMLEKLRGAVERLSPEIDKVIEKFQEMEKSNEGGDLNSLVTRYINRLNDIFTTPNYEGDYGIKLSSMQGNCGLKNNRLVQITALQLIANKLQNPIFTRKLDEFCDIISNEKGVIVSDIDPKDALLNFTRDIAEIANIPRIRDDAREASAAAGWIIEAAGSGVGMPVVDGYEAREIEAREIKAESSGTKVSFSPVSPRIDRVTKVNIGAGTGLQS